MTYFQNIHNLADLKKEYRRLALQHHPDKGGNTAAMQQVNIEFEKLYDVWKDSTNMSANTTGYEYDYSGATAKEYTEYVYNEYRWKGRNYKGQHAPEIVELVRTWLKETYPRYKGELQFHLHQADERGLRGVHQGIRQGTGQHQPLQHRAESRPYRSCEGGDAECMRLCHVIQLRRQRCHDGLFPHQFLPDIGHRQLPEALQGGIAETRLQGKGEAGSVQAPRRYGA